MAFGTRWAVEPGWPHHQFAKAKREFREELMAVLAKHRPEAAREEFEAECREVLRLLA